MGKKQSQLVQLGDGTGDVAIRVGRAEFNEAVAHLSTFLHNVPDVRGGEVSRVQARDALMVLTGFSRDQLGQIAGAGGVPQIGRH